LLGFRLPQLHLPFFSPTARLISMKIPIPKFFSIVSLYLAFSFQLFSAEAYEDDRLTFFTNFLSNPPVVKSLVVSARDTSGGSNNQGIQLVKFQTNAFFFRKALKVQELNSLDPPGHDGELIAGFKPISWRFDNTANILNIFEDLGANTLNNNEARAIRFISPIMNFGLINTLPGSVTFDEGLRFVYTNIDNSLVNGNLTLTNNLPARLDYTINYQGTNFHWLAEIEYSKENSDFLLPRHIRVKVKRDGSFAPFKSFYISSYDIQNDSLPEEEFALLKFANTNTLHVYHDQKGVYTKNDLGEKSYITGIAQPSSTNRKLSKPLVVFIVFTLLLSIPLVAVLKKQKAIQYNITPRP
jgi:hypothetical protein